MSEHWADVPGAHLSGLGLEKDNSAHVGRRRGLFLGGLVSMALFPDVFNKFLSYSNKSTYK